MLTHKVNRLYLKGGIGLFKIISDGLGKSENSFLVEDKLLTT